MEHVEMKRSQWRVRSRKKNEAYLEWDYTVFLSSQFMEKY